MRQDHYLRVLKSVEEPNRREFHYGTLQGHPEKGEAWFRLSFEEAMQRITFEMGASSTPGNFLSRLGAPASRLIQRTITKRALESFGDQSETIAAYWQRYLKSLAPEHQPRSYSAWSFGNTPAMADDLGDLVRRGVKRATTSLGWIYEKFPEEKFPRANEHSIILDSNRAPMCIIRTSSVTTRKYSEIDEAYARTEGEGDGSLAYWRKTHWEFFSHGCQLVGRTPSTDMTVVCEIFEVVYRGNKVGAPNWPTLELHVAEWRLNLSN